MARLILTDMRDAVRAFTAQPRFTMVASLTLALGIGAVTAIFSVVNGILLRPLPNPNPERLVNVWSTAPGLGYDQFPVSPDIYAFYRDNNDVFDEMGVFQTRRGNLTDGEVPEVVDAAIASPSWFPTVGAAFSMGRPYTTDEDLPDSPPVVVVSHRFWSDRRGADPAFIGRMIRVDGEPRQVVGVAPAWLDSPGSPDLWTPTGFDPANPPAGTFGWNVVARLKEGVTAEQAERHLEPLVARAMEDVIQNDNYRAFLTNGQYRPLVNLMRDDIVGNVTQPLWILLATVGMVLLIACANVANLFLIRAEGRQRDLAIRVALGGNRAALVRKLLIEALVLSAIGSGLGVAISAAALPALLRVAPSSIPRLDQVGLDPIVVLFAVAAAFASALIFGLVPAFRYTRPSVVAALRQGGRGGTDEPARRRGRNLLVVAQTAMALILLVGSGLMVRSFSRLMSAELGFDSASAMTFRLTLPQSDYADSEATTLFQNQLADRLRELPGVEAAGAASVLPVENAAPGSAHEFAGQPIAPGQLPPMVHFKAVSLGYFDAMRIPLVSGRDFNNVDLQTDVFTVMVNKALADLYWPGEDPIGKEVRRASGGGPPLPWLTVVGVVGDVLQDGLREPVRPLIYYPLHARGFNRATTFVVRGRGIDVRADELRRAVWAMDDDLPISAMRPLGEIVEDSVVQFRFTMLTLGIAAAMALILGAIGLYGVLSYAVSLRTKEIGVRLALGAPPAQVMRSVVANGAAITAVGLVIGLAGAAGLTRFLSGILFETEPLDLATFAAMSGALLVVGLVASWLPARKAARVSPLESMRGD